MRPRKILRVEALAPAMVHWSADGWQSAHDSNTADSGFGVHFAELPTAELRPGTNIVFTFYWPQAQRWENVDFVVSVEGSL